MIRNLCLVGMLALIAVLAGAGESSPKAMPLVFVLRIDGAIGPTYAEHVAHSLERAAREQAQLVVLQIEARHATGVPLHHRRREA